MTLETELERIKQDFLSYGPGVGRWESYNEEKERTEDKGYVRTRLRLDAEVAQGTGLEDSLDTVLTLVKAELEDLIENGDFTAYNDPFLHSMDGAKKRGVQPEAVYLPSAQLFPYTKKDGSKEYTLYFILLVKWPT